jgi:hypothetical protein
LPRNSSLRILDISKNQFGVSGIIELSNCLKTNGGLTSLNISKNPEIKDTDEGLQKLAECLNDNSFL